MNASLPQPDGSLLVVARVGGDLVIADQLLEAVTAHAPFDELASLVLELARWRHPDEGYVIFYDDETGHRQKITASRLAPELTGDRSVEGPTPWETAARAGTDVVIEDLRMVDSAEPSISAELADFAVAAGMGGCIAAPVVDPAGMVDAVIVIWTTRSGPTHAGHGYALANMRRALALVLQHRAQRILLERAARVDPLTGVWSRAGFFELIEGVSPDTAPTGYHVLYVDLDGFKEVNDSHGHSTGDQVLTTAAARLVELGPENSIVGRLGGDEFVLVCPRQPGDDPVETARRIVDVMALPIETTEGSVSIGASVGIASSRDASSFQQVLDRADAALLRAKSQGRARWITHGTSAHSSQVDTNAR